MFVNRVSNSKLDNYRECHWKYYVRYHEKLPEKRSDSALQFGSYIHKILEVGVREFTLSGLKAIAEEVKESYKFDEKEYTQKKVDKCLSNFLDFNTKISKSETIGLELRESFKIDDFIYEGVIDRVIKAEDGSIMVIDYKTSKSEKTKTDLYMDKQLIGYAVTLSRKFDIPITNITCAHYYPVTGSFVSVKFDKSHQAAFLKEVRNLVWAIRKKTKDAFSPIKNKFCDWCGFRYACGLFNDPVTVQKVLNENRERLKNKDKIKIDE
jgi:ATP-dependent helicase/DNAse subunit B